MPTNPITTVIEEIWRYPVKSLRGERLRESLVDRRGLLGDRLWAVRDPESGKLGSGKNSSRFRRFPGPALLELASRYPVEPDPDEVEPPFVIGRDGREYSVLDGSADLLVQRHTGLRTLRVTRESDVDHFDDGPVSLLGTATLRWVEENLPGTPVDRRRFRPNLLVRTAEPFAEEAWVGRRIRIGGGDHSGDDHGSDDDGGGDSGGGVELTVDMVLPRCVMVTMAQADLPDAPEVLKLLGTRTGMQLKLAILGHPSGPGTVRVGDAVRLADPQGN
jgi:uncharacterized protein YcbX